MDVEKSFSELVMSRIINELELDWKGIICENMNKYADSKCYTSESTFFSVSEWFYWTLNLRVNIKVLSTTAMLATWCPVVGWTY